MSLLLDVRGLRKSFGTTEILRGIDFSVAAQELVFVIGPSGSRIGTRKGTSSSPINSASTGPL